MKNKIKIFFIILMLTTLSMAQSSVIIPIEEWTVVKETALALDSSLTECTDLNKLYESRITEFQGEITSLRYVNLLVDSIIVEKSLQLDKKQQQVKIMKWEVKKKTFEIWIWRGVVVGMLIIGLFTS